MKKREYRGFTIVELVIVIAVIAVLATVLVPTFGDLISRAQAAAATQQVANAYKEALVKALADDGIITEEEKVIVGQFIFTFKEGGQGAQILTEDFPYPQVCIVDGKVQLGPKQENEGDTEASEEPNPPNMPEPTITSEPTTTPEPTIMADSITLDQASLALNVDGSADLTATVLPLVAANREITWTTSNPNVATVENGKVTAVGVGKATITASVDGQTASCVVYVANFTDVKQGTAFKTAVNKAQSVKLQDKCTCSNEIEIKNKKVVVVDLSGFELNIDAEIYIYDGVELIILNGIFNSNNDITIYSGGKLTIQNCTFNANSSVSVNGGGCLTICDSVVMLEERLILPAGATMTVTNCELTAKQGLTVDGYSVSIGSATIVNGKIKTDSSIFVYGNMTFTDSMIEYSGDTYALSVGYSGSYGVSKLTMNNTDVISNSTIIQAHHKSTVNITGGTFTCNAEEEAIVISDNESKVYFHKDGEKSVTIIAEHAYTQKQNNIPGEYCFVGVESVEVKKPT